MADSKVDLCLVCSKRIKTMVFRGTGYCGEVHRKMLGNKVAQKKVNNGKTDS